MHMVPGSSQPLDPGQEATTCQCGLEGKVSTRKGKGAQTLQHRAPGGNRGRFWPKRGEAHSYRVGIHELSYGKGVLKQAWSRCALSRPVRAGHHDEQRCAIVRHLLLPSWSPSSAPRYSDTSTRSWIIDWYSSGASCSTVRQSLPS